MKRPLFVVGLLLLLGACAGVSGSVAEVDGHSIDRGELNEVLDAVAQEVLGDPNLGPQVGSVPGTINRNVSASVLSVMVQSEIFTQRLEEVGVQVTDQDVEAALGEANLSGSATFDALLARLVAMQGLIDAQGITDAFDGVDIDINPRYGQWDSANLIVVPEDAPGSSTS